VTLLLFDDAKVEKIFKTKNNFDNLKYIFKGLKIENGKFAFFWPFLADFF
jgi:hypothetical protein